MPVRYVQDDVSRRVRMTITEPVTFADVIAAVERQLAEGGWSYGLLVDRRGVLSVSPASEIQAFASRVGELVAAHGPRGPIAVITRDPRIIGGVHKYALLAGKGETIDAFWDVADGERWLDQRLPKTRET